MPKSKIGPQQEDLDGKQMRVAGEGEIMNAQLDKNTGWGEQGSLTSDLDRQKAEQQGAKEDVREQRNNGGNVDGGAGGRCENEGIGSV